ncbi:C25 family cysteine peptidase, partial [Xanthovirga aplysinae]|uniref:putative type IX secretion system sortase PorU2 n=1 Tax=Xanthovirga aplysinae TaxID=2529853 RepID=UPI0012BC96C4
MIFRNSLIFSWLFLVISFFSSAQQRPRFGNEWINYNQNYYKIPVIEDGMYRVTYEELENVGFPVDRDPRNIQLFHRGTEQAIYISSPTNATRLQSGDFIEFYGQRNDGWQDAELYVDFNGEASEAQPNPYYNLFSDTTAYFLTSSIDNTRGKRMGEVNHFDNQIEPEPYHYEEIIEVYSDHYNRGYYEQKSENSFAYDYHSKFNFQEGWTGSDIVRKNDVRDYVLEGIQNVYVGAEAELEIGIAGRNNNNHVFKINIKSGSSSFQPFTDGEVTFLPNERIKLEKEIPASLLTGNDLTIQLEVIGDGEKEDNLSVSYIKLLFPQEVSLGQSQEKFFQLKSNSSGQSRLQVNEGSFPMNWYDITDPNNLGRLISQQGNNVMDVTLSQTQNGKKIIAVGNDNFNSVLHINQVSFQSISTNANYLLVTHPKLLGEDNEGGNPIMDYADYRDMSNGGKYNSLVIDVYQLYNQFSYGETTPLAIRRFADYMLENGNPEFLFLVGKGLGFAANGSGGYGQNTFARITAETIRNDDPTVYYNLVPSFGVPGSDVAFTAGLRGSNGYSPAIPTGRLSVNTPQEVRNYLEKVQGMEQQAYNDLWRKNMVFLSGGNGQSEHAKFKGYVDSFRNIAENDYFGGDGVVISKSNSNDPSELINISDKVNEGVSMITFFGHSAPNFTDIEIGRVSDEAMGYDNKNKYPFILVNGCEAGDIFGTADTFGENWLLTPNKGALNFLAHASIGWDTNLKSFNTIFFQKALEDSAFIHQPLGRVYQEVVQEYSDRYNMNDYDKLAQAQQMILQGDPAIRLFGADYPDFFIKSGGEDIKISDAEGEKLSSESKKILFKIPVKNFGITTKDSLRVTIKRRINNNLLQQQTERFASVRYRDTLYFELENQLLDVDKGTLLDFSGTNEFEIILDEQGEITEGDKNNNKGIKEVNISALKALALYPYDNAVINDSKLKLWVQNGDILAGEDQFEIELDTLPSFQSPAKITKTIEGRALVFWEVELGEKDSTTYYWRTKLNSDLGGEWSFNSFTYIKESDGSWGQFNSSQIGENITEGLIYNEEENKWVLIDEEIPLFLKTYGSKFPDIDNKPQQKVELRVRDFEYFQGGAENYFSENNSLNLIAFKGDTKAPYAPISDGSGTPAMSWSGKLPHIITLTSSNILNDSDPLSTYMNEVGEGDYVLIFTIGELEIAEEDEEILTERLNILGYTSEDLLQLKEANLSIFLIQ